MHHVEDVRYALQSLQIIPATPPNFRTLIMDRDRREYYFQSRPDDSSICSFNPGRMIRTTVWGDPRETPASHLEPPSQTPHRRRCRRPHCGGRGGAFERGDARLVDAPACNAGGCCKTEADAAAGVARRAAARRKLRRPPEPADAERASLGPIWASRAAASARSCCSGRRGGVRRAW